MLDLKETEAVELLAALAKRYRIAGRTTVDLFEILATIASHAVVRSAGHVDMWTRSRTVFATMPGATESTE